MINKFLKIAGVSSQDEFLKKFPSEEAFFAAHPEAREVIAQAGGNIEGFGQYGQQQPGGQQMPTGPYDYSKGFQFANSLMDLTGGIAHKINAAKDAREERQRQLEAMAPTPSTIPNQYGTGMGVLDAMAQSGGYVPTGANAAGANVIAEEKEMYEKDGNVFYIDPKEKGAQSHEEGGTPVAADRVLEATSTLDGRNKESDKLLQLTPDMVEEMTGFRPTRNVSHSEALKMADEHYQPQREKYTRKTEKALSTPDADHFALNSAKLNMLNAGTLPTTEHLFDTLFNHQESVKVRHGIGNEANYAQKDGAQAGGVFGNITDSLKKDWNGFVGWMKSSGMSGNKVLDHKSNRTDNLINTYKGVNPATQLTPQIVPHVQKDFIANQEKYGRKEKPMSREDGWVGSVTSTYEYPTAPTQPVVAEKPKPKKLQRWEKLYDDQGNVTSYAPVFDGEWSHFEVKKYMETMPADIKGVPVLRGQPWEESMQGFTPGSTSSQWKPVHGPKKVTYPEGSPGYLAQQAQAPTMQAGGSVDMGIFGGLPGYQAPQPKPEVSINDLLIPNFNKPAYAGEWMGFPYGNDQRYMQHHSGKRGGTPLAVPSSSEEEGTAPVETGQPLADAGASGAAAATLAKMTGATATAGATAGAAPPTYNPMGQGQPNRKDFHMPFPWMKHVPLADMLTMSKNQIMYNEPEVHEARMQGMVSTAIMNRLNADYQTAIDKLPSGGAGIAAQAQLFSAKARATAEQMDRMSQFNTNVENQNNANHAQVQNQRSANKAQALENFNTSVAKRDAIYDAQKQAYRNQWMKNMQNDWATEFTINKLMPNLYPYFNYDGTATGKSWGVTNSMAPVTAPTPTATAMNGGSIKKAKFNLC